MSTEKYDSSIVYFGVVTLQSEKETIRLKPAAYLLMYVENEGNYFIDIESKKVIHVDKNVSFYHLICMNSFRNSKNEGPVSLKTINLCLLKYKLFLKKEQKQNKDKQKIK